MDAKSDGLIKRLIKALLGGEDKKAGVTVGLKSKIGSLGYKGVKADDGAGFV